MKTYILLFKSRDRKGIVAGISDFILRQGGNIINASQYSTGPVNAQHFYGAGPAGGYFFLRIEFVLGRQSSTASLTRSFKPVAEKFAADWDIYDKAKALRMGILVSRPDHCLLDILYLWKIGELSVDIPFVISNYEKHRAIVRQHKIPFYFIPANKNNRREKELLKLVVDNTDFLVLARYMLVLSAGFLKKYNKEIINIHHGLLPSFKGANPYEKALNQGVKVIGATAHFVNHRLDEGPIISQAVEQVTHNDDLQSLLRKGRNLEKRALSDAIAGFVDYRLIKYGNKTIVF